MINANKGRQYTFNGFEVTKANRKAFDLAVQFAKGETEKPLAIFGGIACGKTHLLYAVKNAIEQNSPEIKVIITTADEMQSSLENILNNGGTIQQFREQYMSADILLVDDIQALAGKFEIQNELVLIFNAFFEAGKRFMITSSQKAEESNMNARLVCRSFWGEFAVISRSYVNAKFEDDFEREEKRSDILGKSWRFRRTLSDNLDFDLTEFKSFFKEVWKYFTQYIGVYDVDRRDMKIINDLNRIVTLMECKNPVGIKASERYACIIFLKALIYTFSSYERDIRMYGGGFCGNGYLFMPLHHMAGTCDCLEIPLDEFEKEFTELCDCFENNDPWGGKIKSFYFRRSL